MVDIRRKTIRRLNTTIVVIDDGIFTPVPKETKILKDRIMVSSLGRCRIEEAMLFLTMLICSVGWMGSTWFVHGAAFITVPETHKNSYSGRKTELLLSASDSVVEGMTLKIAIDRKGNVGDASKDFGRFTSEDSLDMVHRLRSQCQGVLVGRVTVERDDCTLTVRRNVQCQQQPTRLILDSQLSLLSSSTAYKALTQSDAPTIIYHILSNEEATEKFKGWQRKQTDYNINEHVSLVSIPMSLGEMEGRINPTDIWNHISQTLQMKHILIEGGPMTAKLFLPIVDRILLVKANNVEFTNQPIKLNITMNDIYKTHVSIGNNTSATMDDTWYYFSKDGTWPSDTLQNWP